MIGICFTNTIPNMPTWGAQDARLGNNPLVLAFPKERGDIVVDMAMSQFSYGALELANSEGGKMVVDAGYDHAGELTRDPGSVIESRRILPTGYWKGAALSFVLDVMAAGLSQGNSSFDIGELPGGEHGVSQVFIAIDIYQIASAEQVGEMVDAAVANLLASKTITEGERIVYPGQRLHEIREYNMRNGIPVGEKIWNEILNLLE
jgi:3-dehydro-L-gulonate 2-dehydrogenase